MCEAAKILILVCIVTFLNCSIQNLTVRKVDRKLIERKRQDTIDTCRLFTESDRLQKFSRPNLVRLEDVKRRNKRDVKSESNSSSTSKVTTQVASSSIALNGEPKVATTATPKDPGVDTKDKRLEKIIDKLYDDMQEKGKKVTYRKPVTTSTTPPTKKVPSKKSGRRFFFRPAILSGPKEKKKNETQLTAPDDTSRIQFDWPKKWPEGIIPYYIDPKTYDVHLSETIIKAFDYFEKATCIRLQRLREKPTDKESLQSVSWLYITNPTGVRQCVHSNEKKPNIGVQLIVFGYDCVSLGEIVHEVMHILGFPHEHTRPDRDQYVSIAWDNIKPGYKKYFEISSKNTLLNLPYDYASVLHYPPRAFSKNGQVTIGAKGVAKLGQREGLSEIDVEKVGFVFGDECLERNRKYLLKTCPTVVQEGGDQTKTNEVKQEEIENYFKDRIWPYGIVNYKLADMEFSAEERENINAVIRHMEKETCIEFRKLDDEKPTVEDKNTVEVEKDGTHKKLEKEEEETTKDRVDQSNRNRETDNSVFAEDYENIDYPTETTPTTTTPTNTDDYENIDYPTETITTTTTPTTTDDYENIDYPTETPTTPTTRKPTTSKRAITEKPKNDDHGNIQLRENPDMDFSNNLVLPSELSEYVYQADQKEIDMDFSNNSVLPSELSEYVYQADQKEIGTGLISDQKTVNVPASVNKAVNTSVKKTVTASVNKTVNTSVKKTVTASVNKTVNTSVKKTVTASVNKTVNESVKETVSAPVKKTENVTASVKGNRRHKREVRPPTPSRRHATDILVLSRSSDPGCKCPPPGRPNGDKVITINADCFNSANDLLHLFVHVLGLDHQHNQHDRDKYLHISWDNLTPDLKAEMQNTLPPAASVGFGYDYHSIMHYPWLEIKNGVTNIMYPIWNDGWAMGHWQGLSSSDVKKLNQLYFSQCQERKKFAEEQNRRMFLNMV